MIPESGECVYCDRRRRCNVGDPYDWEIDDAVCRVVDEDTGSGAGVRNESDASKPFIKILACPAHDSDAQGDAGR